MSAPDDLRARLRAALDQDPTPVLPADTVPAGVLVPIVAAPEPTLVLTRRAEHLTRHPGEISFPGGLRDDGDAGLVATALREFEEELGVGPERVEVLGALAPVHTVVSGVLMLPFVGWLASLPTFRPDPREIAEVLAFPLAELERAEQPVELAHDGRVHRGFAYPMGEHTIWGATGRALHDLLAIVGRERV
ncbi:MAG: NUDIX hydrolase [Actinomycetota bacterium]